MSQAFKITPMYRQYLEIKKDYPDALVFYRMGDFYELFFDDAKVASKELQLALTSRSREEDGVPMCGVPWHAAESYISQLIEKGYKIAVCDQMEDPRQAKGLVKRAVTRVVTRGTALEEANLASKEHSYLGAAIWNSENSAGGFAWLDASTGAWTGLQSGKVEEIRQWILKMEPKELLVPDSGKELLAAGSATGIQFVRVPFQSHFELKKASSRVMAAQHVQELHALGLEKSPELVQACGALVAYLEHTQKQDPAQLGSFTPLDRSKYLVLDEVTEKNLELFQRMDGKRGKGTLCSVMDYTRTSMGGRMLEERLHCPWRQLDVICTVQDAVQFLKDREDIRKALRSALDAVQDLERLSTRISLNRCQPHDFSALKTSLAALPMLRSALLLQKDQNRLSTEDERNGEGLPSAIRRAVKRWDMMDDLYRLLDRALNDQLPVQITDGGIFRSGYNEELDQLIDLVEHGESKLQDLLHEEQKKNDFPKLKLGYNHVFGYYFELSRAQQTKPLPEYFERRQSLVNSERFSTPGLRELEEKIFNASEKRKSLEYRLYQDLRDQVARERSRLVFMADIIAHVDYWQSLAEGAARCAWNRPVLNDGNGLKIMQGRHPVVEAISGKAAFIPNDLIMNEEKHLIIVTGPNMAGKSTVLRQTAIICIMAQMGSFVPAEEAVLGIADRIFSRVGASDNLAQGQSTFMVEMMETARILRQSGRRSLVILDEIGRGTSTFDGLALAWAVVEELAKRAGGSVRTLFATHYHELTSLANTLQGVCNMNIAVREWNGDIVFLRRLIPGPADRSYGVEVAKLAGVPSAVVQRARDILKGLESSRGSNRIVQLENNMLPGLSENKAVQQAETVHPLLIALQKADVNAMTPMEALRLLAQWKELWG